jgi:transcriptional regulator with XRE-family HTH domain
MSEVILMTLEDYRLRLGWSVAELSRRSGVSAQTIARAERGEPIRTHIAATLARVLSAGLNQPITFRDFEGLNVV